MAATDLVVAEIVLAGSLASQGGDDLVVTKNVFQFFRDNTVNPWSGSAILTAFAASVGVAYKAAVSIDAGNFILSMRNMNDALHAGVEQVMAGAGAIIGERLPSYCSVCLHLKSGFKGRSYRGRKHFGGIAETSSNGDVLTAGAITLFAAVGAAIVLGFTDADGNIWKPAVVQFSASQLLDNPTAVLFVPVLSTTVTTELGFMTRRHA